MPKMQITGWQPIETAPLDGARVLILFECWGSRYVEMARFEYPIRGKPFWRFESKNFNGHDMRSASVTHWMPVPSTVITRAVTKSSRPVTKVRPKKAVKTAKKAAKHAKGAKK